MNGGLLADLEDTVSGKGGCGAGGLSAACAWAVRNARTVDSRFMAAFIRVYSFAAIGNFRPKLLFTLKFTPRVKRRGIDNKLRLHLFDANCYLELQLAWPCKRSIDSAVNSLDRRLVSAITACLQNTSQRLACHSLQKRNDERRIRLFEVFLTYTTSLAEAKKNATRASLCRGKSACPRGSR